MVTETAARPNPAVTAQEELAEELTASISAKQQAVVPTPSVSKPADTGDTFSSLGDIATMISNTQAKVEEGKQKLQSVAGLSNDSAEAASRAIVDGIEARQIIALQEDNAKLTAQQNTIAVFEAGGGQAEQIDRAADSLELEKQLETLRAEETEIMSTEITGIGIVDAIINDFRSVGVAEKIEATTKEYAQNLKDVQTATTITQSAAQSNVLVKKNVSAGTIAANQRVIAADGQAQLYQVELQQNQTNAENLRTVMNLDMRQMDLALTGLQIEQTAERIEMDRRQEERAIASAEQTLRRGDIEEQIATLRLQYDVGTMPARIQQQIVGLESDLVQLDRSTLAFKVEQETADAKITQSQTASEAAQISLERAKEALEETKDPDRKAALQAQYDAALTSADRAAYEFEEIKINEGMRAESRAGALQAQQLNNKITENNLAIQQATKDGKIIEANALAAENARIRTDAATVRANNTENVVAFQSFIYGADSVETAQEINNQLDQKNPLYIMMRQLGSARGPNGEFILGTNPARANASLQLLEQNGVVSNDITGVRVLREVRALQQKMWEDNPTAMPADETAAALQFNQLTTKYLSEKSDDVVFNDVTNPFTPPTIPQAVELSPTYAAQPLTQILAKEGQVDANVDQIIAKGLVAMQTGQLTLDQVVDGVVSLGRVTALNTNFESYGLGTIGMPSITKVNMRVAVPRGEFTSTLNSLGSAAATYGKVGLPGMVLGKQLDVVNTLIGNNQDFTTLNIANDVEVMQYINSVLSSTTLGGETTPNSMTGESDKPAEPTAAENFFKGDI